MAKNTQKQDNKLAVSVAGTLVRLAMDAAIYVLIVLAAISLCRLAYDFGYRLFGPHVTDGVKDRVEYECVIGSDESPLNLAERLEDAGIISDRYSFAARVKIENLSFREGSFLLNSDMDYDKILDMISKPAVGN